MLTAFLAGVIVGAILFWKISRWWRKSSIKKASDAVGAASQGPTKVAKNLFQKAKNLFDETFNPKSGKREEEDE
ncbi:MAG TPA: hypothetical protein VL283_05660 [Candidatus Baltobacteraceae bacterium]|jgi:hypothetical protein|nr:hypothetical protein [Candidatus Baltobacteraceae bacterium]